MTKRQFLKQRRPAWRQFEQLVARAGEIGRRKFSSREIALYSRLLREISHDLALVRGKGWDLRLEGYLNELAGRGYNGFYRAPPGRWRRLGRFFLGDYPRLLRKHGFAILAGCALFFVPCFIAWGAVVAEPRRAQRILPVAMLEQLDRAYGEQGEMSESAAGGAYVERRSLMFGFYINNNIGIAFSTFALGLTFAVGTIYTLLANGIVIGTVMGHVQAAGNGERLFSFVVTHGSFELTAIGISGGAGLVLGNALLHPGNRTRWEALQIEGGDAIQIAGGAGAMLLIAAFLEAFWSPAPIAPIYKYLVGAAAWTGVLSYVLLAGRRTPEDRR